MSTPIKTPYKLGLKQIHENNKAAIVSAYAKLRVIFDRISVQDNKTSCLVPGIGCEYISGLNHFLVYLELCNNLLIVNSYHNDTAHNLARKFLIADLILSNVSRYPTGKQLSKAKINGKSVTIKAASKLRLPNIHKMLSINPFRNTATYFCYHVHLMSAIDTSFSDNEVIKESFPIPLALDSLGEQLINEVNAPKSQLDYISRLAENVHYVANMVDNLEDTLTALCSLDTITKIDDDVVRVSEILTNL